MNDNEPQVIASAQYRCIDGRVHLQILKVGRHYQLVRECGGERCMDTFKNEEQLKQLLGDSEIDQNRGFEDAFEALLSEFTAAQIPPDPLDILLEESKLKSPFL